MKNFWKKVGLLSVGSFIVALSFFAGLYVDASNRSGTEGQITIYDKDGNPQTVTVDFSLLYKTLDVIGRKYVDRGNASTTADTIVYGAVKGLVDSLGDPYSMFFTPEENEAFEEELSGSLEGVGMSVGIKEDGFYVISPIKNSPAERAGVKAGYKILKVAGQSVADMSLDEAVKLIRGKKGTAVDVVFETEEGKEIKITLVRDVIIVPSVETKYEGKDTFYVKINEFNANASSQFRTAMKDLYASKRQKLIIDLRNNPGGYLDSAVDIASWFLPSGKVIVTEDYGHGSNPRIHRSRGYNIFDNLQVVVLVNEGSASASEILAGALADYNVAALVGTKTFGKGSVQEVVYLDEGSALKITVAKWLTPKGKSLSKNGINPEFEVKAEESPDDASKDDKVYQKALEVLKSK